MNTSAAAATPGGEERPDGPAMIGSELQQERKRRGYTLADVEAYLRIRHSHLEAIEAGRFSDLPGTTYVLGFIRSYAQFLELDADEIVGRVEVPQSQKPARYQMSLQGSGKQGKLAVIAIPLVATGAVVLAIAGWYYFSSNNLSITDLGGIFGGKPSATSDVEDPRSPAGEPETANVASSAGEPDSGPATSAAGSQETAGQADERLQADETEATPDADSRTVSPPVPQPTDGETAASPAEAPPATASPDEVQPAVASRSRPATESATPPRDGTTSQILLQATDETFIALRIPNGQIFMSQVLRAGEVYEIPSERPTLFLDTGNAGALRIVVDGRALPPLGAVGAVVRNVPLDPRKLLERRR